MHIKKKKITNPQDCSVAMTARRTMQVKSGGGGKMKSRATPRPPIPSYCSFSTPPPAPGLCCCRTVSGLTSRRLCLRVCPAALSRYASVTRRNRGSGASARTRCRATAPAALRIPVPAAGGIPADGPLAPPAWSPASRQPVTTLNCFPLQCLPTHR